MATPSVRFTTAADGQRIAYTEEGEGDAYVVVQSVADVQLSRKQVETSALADGLSASHRLLFLDPRGSGLSPGHPELDGWVRDVQAVFDETQIDRAILHGTWVGCAAAIAFAAREPARVSKLILENSFAVGRELAANVPAQSVARLSQVDFQKWLDVTSNLLVGPGDDLAGTRAAIRAMWERLGAAGIDAINTFVDSLDVRPELAQVSTPTLVLAYSEGGLGVDLPLAVAAALDDSRSVVLPHRWRNPEDTLEAIREFLGEDSSGGTASSLGPFRTILFTDVVASTPILAQLKDARMREVMRDHDAVLQAAVDEHDGRVVKEMGDAFMAEFAVPSAAVACAIAMQRGIQAQFADTDVPIRLRIGINAGEPVEEDGDLHGASVVIAKRLESAAAEKGILVSEVVKQAVAGKEFEFTAKGDIDLKGFDEPVRAWAVEWA